MKTSLVKVGFKGDFLGYKSVEAVGAPSHANNPYAFKIYAIDKAKALGYEVVLWCDASIYPVQSVQPALDWISDKRYLMEEAGHYAGTWSNDRTLKYFGITRDEAMKIPTFSAGFMGLDFTSELVREFYARFKNSCLDGMFKGDWVNKNNSESNDPRCKGHRHDLSCASIIAHQLGMEYSEGALS
ncbi:MAG: hypothetical protein KAI81_07795 [Candidatus Marinimicrobia bacterium]|nr:hypothetical protein [Candidatus Neomarinimicrobiota bacterium]